MYFPPRFTTCSPRGCVEYTLSPYSPIRNSYIHANPYVCQASLILMGADTGLVAFPVLLGEVSQMIKRYFKRYPNNRDQPIPIAEFTSSQLSELVPFIGWLQTNPQQIQDVLRDFSIPTLNLLFRIAEYLEIEPLVIAFFRRINQEKITTIMKELQAKIQRELILNSNQSIREIVIRLYGTTQEDRQLLVPILLQEIIELDLAELGLRELAPNAFQGLSQLQGLYLHGNQLTNLPETLFKDLSGLQWLALSRNLLTTLPPLIFIGLDQLKFLDLSLNQMPVLLNTQFQGLHQLNELNLSGNQLNNLPSSIFQDLVQLQYLDLSGNQLTNLSETLFQEVNQLQNLNLSENQLGNLPAMIFQGLNQLQILNLSRNQLSNLPETIFWGLNRLKWINLIGNPIAIHLNKYRFKEIYQLPPTTDVNF